MSATLYLSGPIRGKTDFRSVFAGAEAQLVAVGYKVVNPCDVGTIYSLHASDWARNMRADIKAMMDCDGIAYLPGWQHSSGASVEIELAVKLEMPAMSVQDWLTFV